MGEDTAKIATVLDVIEQLPRFLAAEEDHTEDFEQSLLELSRRFPELGIGLERFRRNQAPERW